MERVCDPGEDVVPLPFPITFVLVDADRFADIAAADPPPLPGDVHARFEKGEDNWIIVSYLVLKHRGHDVRLSDHFVDGALCIAHRGSLRWRDFAYQSFVVAIRADRGPVYISEHRLVQSPGLADGKREHFVPYWPQPGLLPRDASRGDRITRVGFLGQERNLDPELRSDDFRRRLADLGMELVIRSQRAEWADYRDLDVVLAVRGGNPRWLLTKPPSKLVNAWLAGCPALLGPEPAFEALRESDLDYCPVTNSDEVIAALTRLRDEPGWYRSMVENGQRRGGDYTIARVAQTWEQILRGPVGSDYLRWCESPRLLRRPRLFARHLPRALMHRLLPNRYQR